MCCRVTQINLNFALLIIVISNYRISLIVTISRPFCDRAAQCEFGFSKTVTDSDFLTFGNFFGADNLGLFYVCSCIVFIQQNY